MQRERLERSHPPLARGWCGPRARLGATRARPSEGFEGGREPERRREEEEAKKKQQLQR